jgi:hypothetical protein
VRLPGFTAELSLGPNAGVYRQRTSAGAPLASNSVAGQASSTMVPQLEKARRCTTVYSGYVTYPMVVCRPPNITTGGNQAGNAGARIARFSPFCRTLNGPWLAYVSEQESCDSTVNSYSLSIVGAPQPVHLEWAGTLDDVPGPVGAIGNLSPSLPTCYCCGATKQCLDGSCVPLHSRCDEVISPA